MIDSKTLTTPVVLNGTAAVFVRTGTEPKTIRVFANRLFHVKIHTGIVATAAVGDSMPVAAFTEKYLTVGAHENISFLMAAGETAGLIWITE